MELRYTARRAGPIDEVYACRVFGMALPLGFAISGKNRGPTLSFGLVGDGEGAPRPIQRSHLPQYVGEEPLPEPEPAPPLEVCVCVCERAMYIFCLYCEAGFLSYVAVPLA